MEYERARDVLLGADNSQPEVQQPGPGAEETCRSCLRRCGDQASRWNVLEAELAQKLMAFAAVQVRCHGHYLLNVKRGQGQRGGSACVLCVFFGGARERVCVLCLRSVRRGRWYAMGEIDSRDE